METGDGRRRDRHFTWSSEQREDPAACSAKGAPSFLSYFKTLSTGPALVIEPRDLPLCLPTELILPRLMDTFGTSTKCLSERDVCLIESQIKAGKKGRGQL